MSEQSRWTIDEFDPTADEGRPDHDDEPETGRRARPAGTEPEYVEDEDTVDVSDTQTGQGVV